MTFTRKYLRITITGESTDDLILSLDTVRDYVSRGCQTSYGEFEDSDYEFDVTEEVYSLN
jgi:hypothetical protein